MPGLHPANQVLKERLLNSPLSLCFERAEAYTDTYRQTEGEHPSLRAAKALRDTFQKMSIRIDREELLVGNRASRYDAPPFAPEKGDFNYVFQYLLPDLRKYGYQISKAQERVLFKKILPYWKGKTVRDLKVAALENANLTGRLNLSKTERRRKIQAFGWKNIRHLFSDNKKMSRTQSFFSLLNFLFHLPRYLGGIKGGSADNVKGRGRCIDTQAHIVIGHKNVLKYGFKGIKQQALERAKTATEPGQQAFLEGVVISCESMKDFSDRFALLAQTLSLEEVDPSRTAELREIARICSNVPLNPAETFHEAVQAIWFMQNAAIISYGAGSGITPGRLDQLLYPFYKKDLAEGTIDQAQALRLLEELIIKLNDNVVIWPNIVGVKLNPLGSDIENVTIGGIDRDGKDATNELSYLFIEAIKNTKLATSVSFRLSPKSPKDFLQKILLLNRETSSPALFNDEITIKMLVNDGYTVQDARDYCLVGCVEPNDNAKTFGATGGSKVYFPTALDLVFNRGKTTFFGSQDSDDTGDPTKFITFEELMDAFFTHLNQIVVNVATAINIRDGIWAKHYHNPLISCTIDGCIEHANDMTCGGALYNFGAIGGAGLGTVVDSLAAIKKRVFDEKIVTLGEIISAIATNFKDQEALRQRLKNCPKYGNDDDYVDSIATRVVARFCEMVSNQKLDLGGRFKASLISYGLNVYEGMLEPATPDGRLAGEPLSNSISPSNGAERNGPTATLKSVAKIDHTKIGYGDSLNMRFPTYLLATEKGISNLQALVETYFGLGGFHVQINTVGTDMLRDAQAHPEQYQDLIVRVSGYSAYFTQLGREIQDDIIDRVEFSCS